jgi:putative hydroxymethylpyrimidine transport system substrate-binding protein
MFKRRVIFLALLAALFYSCFSLAAAAPPAPAFKPLTVVLDWFINPDHAPLFVAQQQGFFQQQGLTVNFVPPADPANPAKFVAIGKADLAITYQQQLVLDVNAGMPLVRIATLIGTPLDCIVVRADSAIHSIADLKGKRVGYSMDTFGDAMLSTMLKQHGLSLSDVKRTRVGYDLVQALLSNNVDAITDVVRNFEPLEMALAGHPARVFYAEENGMPPYDEFVIVANRQHLTDPRLPRFVKALTLGVQYLVNHPEESWQLFAKNHPELNNELNHRAWLATLPRFALTPAAFDQSRYRNLALFLQQQKLINTVPPLSSYVVELNYD